MMNDEQTAEAPLEDDELVFEVVKPLGGVVSVRFNGDEMRRLRAEVRKSGATVSSLIKQATLGHIARMDHERRVEAAMQSPAAEDLWAVWLSQEFTQRVSAFNAPAIERLDAPDGWNDTSTSDATPTTSTSGPGRRSGRT